MSQWMCFFFFCDIKFTLKLSCKHLNIKCLLSGDFYCFTLIQDLEFPQLYFSNNANKKWTFYLIMCI